MQNMKKKIVEVLLGDCMGAGLLAGCGGGNDTASMEVDAAVSEDSASGNSYHFEVVVKSCQATYWHAAMEGIDAAIEELGVTVNTTEPNAESDIADQVNMLNNAISQQPDGIALVARDQSAVLDSLQDALDATPANISGRGMGFIKTIKELIEADGKTVAVTGN